MKKVEVELDDVIYQTLCQAAAYADYTPGEFLGELYIQTLGEELRKTAKRHPRIF